jgi:glycosyltransferase involved in cell wall biosynthesis
MYDMQLLNPEISIITPLYNGSKTLLETALSVLSQDFKNWEWILFDDGSTDSTHEVVAELLAKEPNRIKYFEHENNANHGTAFTRNRAVEKSTGEIISFIDQDDIWSEDRLSHQYEILKKHDECAMIWSPALYWYTDRSFVQSVGYRGKGLKPGVYIPPSFVKIFLSDLKGTPLPSGSLLRRKHFEEVNGYDESIRGSEDIVLWLKIAQKYPIYFDEKVLIKYRKHEDSTLRVAKRSGKMDEWDLTFYRWVNKFLKEGKADKELIDENAFAYYKTLKRMLSKEGYFKSRIALRNKLKEHPEIGKSFSMDYLLDLTMPFDLASRISAKIRFDLLKKT